MTHVPMSSPDVTDAEVIAINQVLQTRYLSMGPRIDAFERAVATYVGARHAVAVTSGTSGLHLAVIAAGVRDGDLVLTTPFSFVASANCILYERGIPVFVDVDPASGNINPSVLAEMADSLVQGGKAAARWLPPSIRRAGRHRTAGSDPAYAVGRLKAILPVDVFGQPADYDLLQQVADRHDLAMIEDSCEAIGAEYKGRSAGTLGDAAVLAFYPNKQITTGEGGVILTDRDAWADLFRSLRNQGRDLFDTWLNHTRLGYNYRLDELSAALGLAQLERIQDLLAKREQVAKWYNERLAELELVERPTLLPTTTRMSWFVYVVRIRPPARRNQVMRYLADHGVPSRPYFTPIHLQPFYRERFGYRRGDFPIAEHLGDVSLALPFSSVMTEAQVDTVYKHLRAAAASADEGYKRTATGHV